MKSNRKNLLIHLNIKINLHEFMLVNDFECTLLFFLLFTISLCLFRPIQQFPSQLSFESLVPLNNGSTRPTNLTTDSLPSSPSLTSLDKISTTSNNVGFYRHQFSHPLASPTKVKVFFKRIFQ
jgi:hypothetical protein